MRRTPELVSQGGATARIEPVQKFVSDNEIVGWLGSRHVERQVLGRRATILPNGGIISETYVRSNSVDYPLFQIPGSRFENGEGVIMEPVTHERARGLQFSAVRYVSGEQVLFEKLSA